MATWRCNASESQGRLVEDSNPMVKTVAPEDRHLPYMGQEFEKRLHVRNIPIVWDEWKLFHVFRRIGTVHDISLPPQKLDSRLAVYRFGFVEMMSLADVDKVLARLDGHGYLYVEGLERPLQVQLANARSNEKRPQGVTRNEFVKSSGQSSPHKELSVTSDNKSSKWQNRSDFVDWKGKGGVVPVKITEDVVMFSPAIHTSVDLPHARVMSDVSIVLPPSGKQWPYIFYVLTMEKESERCERENAIIEQIAKTKPYSRVEENQLVLVKQEAGGIQRGKVIKVNGGKALIFGVDTACTFTVSINELRPITKEIAEIPFRAVPCALYGIVDPTEMFTDMASSCLFNFCSNSCVNVKLIKYDKNINIIQVFIIGDDSESEMDFGTFLETLKICKYVPPKSERFKYTKEQMHAIKDIVNKDEKPHFLDTSDVSLLLKGWNK